jgi:hypothetical protein
MRQASIHQLAAAARKADFSSMETYLVSYPEFVRYYQQIDVIDRHHLIVGANMVYGWMPTILHFKSHAFDAVICLLNDAKRGRLLSLDELTQVKDLINNSMVGASKLLHFVNPELYPIWDGKICVYLMGKRHDYVVNNVTTYIAYLEHCHALVQEAYFEEIHRLVQERLSYPVSACRAVELTLFAAANQTE